MPALALAGLALAAFFAVQRMGFIRRVEAGLEWIARRWPAAALGNGLRRHDNLNAIYARHRSIVLAAAGLNPSVTEAIIVESPGQAVRGLAFPVPGALGVQEGGYLLIGSLYGLASETCLALSFVKRLPYFVIGVPGLLA